MNEYLRNFISVCGSLILLCLIVQCEEQQSTQNAPEIDMNTPPPCDTLTFGEQFRFKATFTDDENLGNYKINIHHNFDHHTHGTHEAECQLDSIKQAHNPYFHNWVINIPQTTKTYTIDTMLNLPAANDTGLYEGGDYHLMLYLTDEEGHQSWIGRDLKIRKHEQD